MTIDLRKIINYLKRLSMWRKLGLIIGTISLAVVFVGVIIGFFRWRAEAEIPQQPTKVVEEILEPTPTSIPTSLPTPVPSPTPELRSAEFVVWTNQGPGVYLRDLPGGLAIDVLPNGTVLDKIDQEIHTSKGINWVQVRFHDQSGWMARHLVYEMEGIFFLVDNRGDWLFAGIEERVDTRLQPGTPYYLIEVDQASSWLKVRLADGSEGWLKSR
ncbi:MAG: hypothetical protein ISR58_12305 [Anaerolineales bacterium]|nr:hypothetical protein [Chloroflexota bacterium]MBL6981960.1 hypothetical protein [Anaerolineales bacterium]